MMKNKIEKETVNSSRQYLLSALSFAKYLYKLVQVVWLSKCLLSIHCEPGIVLSEEHASWVLLR